MLRRGSARSPLSSADALRRSSLAVLVVLAAGEPPGAAQLAAAAPLTPDREELARWRGRIDAHALWARYSDPDVMARLAPSEGPRRILFVQLEQARVEALGSHGLPGMRANLAAWHAAAAVPLGAQELRAARGRFAAPTIDGGAAAIDAGAADWRCGVAAHTADLIEAMAAVLDDQIAFAAQALQLVRLAEPGAPQEQRTPPEPQSGAGDSRSAAQTAAADATDAPGGGAPLDAIRGVIETPRGIPAPLGGDLHSGTGLAGTATGKRRYRAYTREFDRVCEARGPDAAEAAALQPEMRRLAQARVNFAGWARRLERHLRGRQERAWRFDQPEGVIDAARLVRVVTARIDPLIFKREVSTDGAPAAVTLLIDCSGSMRGVPIATAAGCADLLASVFELCGVHFEILGFTTREWHGGRSRQRWIADGRPADPGRLTDLLHIVFKSGDLPWRRTRPRLLAMLDEGLLKENVDGEALLWAFERLRRRTEARRLLVVISDGAPRDDCTAAVNDAGYLARHLRRAIAFIESRSPVELLAVGIGHNVGAYYSRSLTVTGPENLGEALVLQLIPLLRGRGGSRSAGSERGGPLHTLRR